MPCPDCSAWKHGRAGLQVRGQSFPGLRRTVSARLARCRDCTALPRELRIECESTVVESECLVELLPLLRRQPARVELNGMRHDLGIGSSSLLKNLAKLFSLLLAEFAVCL